MKTMEEAWTKIDQEVLAEAIEASSGDTQEEIINNLRVLLEF